MTENSKALEDLKKLVFKGMLTETVEIDGVKFVLKTLTLQEEMSVLEESGLQENPRNVKELLAYIPVALSYSIKSINNETPKREQVLEMLKQSTSPDVLSKLYSTYLSLENRRASAGESLKNLSTIPPLDSIG